ncbi:MAG: DHH family phosphoesterase [Clostridia bacterium]|nr:DHH family phosphoesterase [Clostridia bacterium]
MRKETRRIATKADLLVCILLACFAMLAFAIVCEYTELMPIYVGAVVLLAYLLLISLWAGIRIRKNSADSLQVLRENYIGDTAGAVMKLKFPAVICNEKGAILWCNQSMIAATGHADIIMGAQIGKICEIDPAEFADGAKGSITLGGRDYIYEEIRLVYWDGSPRYFIYFEDCTELNAVKRLYEDERTIVAYVVIDNIEELLQYVQEKFALAAAEVEKRLKNWAASMNGILRSYENDKYILFMDADKLKPCLESRFSIMDEIRDVRVGDSMPVTISMGVANIRGTLLERERMAQSALDMALQRGGDQVVYRSDDGITYYGGKTKAVYKRTNVRSRVIANRLSALIGRADNVLVMGHRFGDFDSFGAAIGVAKLAMIHDARVNIVVNRGDQNLRSCFEKIGTLEAYEYVFVDGATAMDLIRPDTLLVIVDVNNFNHVEYPNIARNVRQIVVIDHHRKTGDFPVEPVIEYIEPSASSASEMVAEMLQHQLALRNLEPEEAELLLSGIILDTKQFTRNAGVRTFSVAMYLRGEGASPGDAQEMFKSEVEDLTKEARFHTHVMIYRENVAIAVCDGETDSSFRVIAAKAADRLLSVRKVDASFAVVRIGDVVHISGRSNGKVNVQIILERMHGGGHFDVAGAQVNGESIHNVLTTLKASIDYYFDEVAKAQNEDEE